MKKVFIVLAVLAFISGLKTINEKKVRAEEVVKMNVALNEIKEEMSQIRNEIQEMPGEANFRNKIKLIENEIDACESNPSWNNKQVCLLKIIHSKIDLAIETGRHIKKRDIFRERWKEA